MEVERVEVGMGESVYVVEDCERVFSVGELVEYWEGPVVRTYRTDSGDPAFVKEKYGLGWYGIRSKWWEALGGEIDECIGKACTKTAHFRNKLEVLEVQE